MVAKNKVYAQYCIAKQHLSTFGPCLVLNINNTRSIIVLKINISNYYI